ncbi:hypothetical protein ACK3SF_00185 [Candidatus Nanosalina sp. VS9-1]|uniref:hypothetical protein n=1 Tax=Candidatus Nanosalina sp. VS9-1 TaxID=3388566 RepID=UPI0039E01623
MVNIDGHIQRDPIFREQSEIYASLGGQTPIRVFSSISRGETMNDVIESLFQTGSSGWQAGENFGHFEMQLRDILDDMEEKKLVQNTPDGWELTGYGGTWRTQMDQANHTLMELVNDNHIAASYFEASDGDLVYEGEDTVGNLYNALGFNMLADSHPEALPVLYILGEEVNDGEVPEEYMDAVEQLSTVGLLEYDATEEGSLENVEITEMGRRVYDDVVLDDRETVADHYGL